MTLIEPVVLEQLEKEFQRVFAFSLGRSTLREVQNAIVNATQSNQEQSNAIFEGLMSGQYNKAAFSKESEGLMNEIVEKFSIPVRLSKEVFERGDFISLVTSDTLTQQNRAIFLNRIRKVDGEEFQFIIDPPGAIYMIHHFITRLEEYKKIDAQKNLLEPLQKDIEQVKTRLENLLKKDKN